MSCKGALNVPDTEYEPCDVTCSYDFNFRTKQSSCQITNKGSYLNINCYDGNNTIEFSNIKSLDIEEVRLYQPSVNKWNDVQYDAELIIKHKGDGKNLYVCVPIKVANNNNVVSNSIHWFTQLHLEQVNNNKTPSSINIGGTFNLSMVMPNGGFYYIMKNGLSWGPGSCNENSNSMILFREPIQILPKDLTFLKNKISATPASSETLYSADGLYNSKGVNTKSGEKDDDEEKYITTCTPIVDQEDIPIDIEGNTAEFWNWVKKEYETLEVPPWVPWVILGIILVVLAIKYKDAIGHWVTRLFEQRSKNAPPVVDTASS